MALLLWLWQLPQNIIGLVFWGWFAVRGRVMWAFPHKGKKVIYADGMRGGISLGNYIILDAHAITRGSRVVDHEYGHTIQSLYLGPLYLLIVGIPSLLHAYFYIYDYKDPNKYYRFFTERWADKLGGIIR